jgi:spore maturation protein CgeB
MRFLFYTHSLVSDWNHGNAHFLRGVMRALAAQGHTALALEPAKGWSRENLLAEQGPAAVQRFFDTFPDLVSRIYGPDFDHEAALDAADVVVVHEWTDPALVAQIGRLRANGGRFTLLFHDTHHRAVTEDQEIGALDLGHYDGVLAFGETLRERYLAAGWGRQVFVWHEAADDSLFRPLDGVEKTGDLIWIGNWGDGERSEELWQFLLNPAIALDLRTKIRGVRYPQAVLARLGELGIGYGGWIANADVPQEFARHRATVHVPRRPYVQALPGIPTIRMFEALACGIPLISAPWDDTEGLFRAGQDYLTAKDGAEMQHHLRAVLHDKGMAEAMAAQGLRTIQDRHTCRHRVDALLGIIANLRGRAATNQESAA